MVPYPEPYPGNGMFKSFTKSWHREPYGQISPQRPELSAAGKVVFITGGGTGIGKATAIAFAQAGARAVAIFGRRVEKLNSATEEIRKASNGTTTVVYEVADLTQRSATKAAFTNAIKQVEGSKIDIFINNAGALTASGTVAGYEEEEFNKAVQMNMATAFNSVQAALPLLSSNAKVFNISSGIAHIFTIPGVWPYAATKAATIKMFDYLQEENPDLHVVNIQPGVVDTEINAKTDFKGQDEGK
jgi:NAD(P)-dependent dehydrogenase (short-subunit alcohol dehydrogenase family)